MHHKLESQIREFFGDQFIFPPEWKDFLKLVSDAYSFFDEDRAALNRSLENYQTLVNNLSVGVYRNTPGPQGHFLEANPAIISLFEADSKEDFLKHNVSDLYQDPAKRALFVEKITKYGFVKDEELDLVTLKGKKLICSVSAVMKKDKDGNIYFDGLIEDITKRKRMEEELRNARDELEIRVKERTETLQRTNENLAVEVAHRKKIEDELKKINNELDESKKAILNVLEDLSSEKVIAEKGKAKTDAILTSIADGCIVVDEKGNIVMINCAAQEMLGYTSSESIGKKWHEILHREDESGSPILPEQGAIYDALFNTSRTRIKTLPAIYYYVRRDRTKFPVTITVAPVIFENKIVGAIEVFRDVTREREIDKTKTEFVSLASHQLRTPLATVSWYTEMLLSGDTGELNEKQKQYLEEVYRSNRRMVDLVKTLLNVSRLELGTFMIEPEQTDVTILLQSLVDEQKHLIDKGKIQLSTSFEKNIPLIAVDQKLLRIVVQNLLSNSIKYTPERGKVDLSLRLVKRNTSVGNRKADEDCLAIVVSDTGYGIPRNQQDKVFGKLFRADNVQEKNAEGTGLGLYIVKFVVDHSGGKIWFESEENKGTTFYVTIPLAGMKKKEGTKALS